LIFLAAAVSAAHGQSPVFPVVQWVDADKDQVQDATIETETLKIIISSRTGNISFFYLKGRNFEENLFPPILQDFGYSYASSTLAPFEVIPGSVQSEAFAASIYSLRREPSDPDKLVIIAVGPPLSGALSLSKRFTFFRTGYAFHQEVIISNLSASEVVLGNAQLGSPGLKVRYGPGIFLDPFTDAAFLAIKKEGHDVFDTSEKLLKGVAAGEFTGIGLKTSYFCMLMEAPEPVSLNGTTFESKSSDPKKKVFHGNTVEMGLKPFSVASRDSRSFLFRFYFGPKILDELKSIGRETVTDYGFLSTMLLRILQFFTALIPNYGLAIIFLTLVVRILLYPLTVSQTKSMAKMQKIQPLIQDIKDRYKDEPQRFNEEVLKLYQKHEVNPLGGCLPLILQLPVLIALYNTINIAVELRKTPFLWMSDLSKSDPILLLPVAIAALMYFQQGKITDPQQQQMMTFMPMFMFVITWSLPAGLLLYWFTSSVIGVLQQIQANRIISAAKEER
jgi:YidC/Oxa1 family membrane protein insertase